MSNPETISIDINVIYWIVSTILIRCLTLVLFSEPVLRMKPTNLRIIKPCPVIPAKTRDRRPNLCQKKCFSSALPAPKKAI